MIDFLEILFVSIAYFTISIILLLTYYSLNTEKKYHFKHYNHIKFLIILIISISIIYFLIYLSSKKLYLNISSSNLVPVSILSIYMLYKSIYISYYKICFDKIKNINKFDLPKHYYLKDNNCYLHLKYYTLSKVFRYLSITILLILSIIIGFTCYIYNIKFINTISTLISFIILPLLLFEISIYFDGIIETNQHQEEINKKNKKNNILFNELDLEYYNLWKKQILARYNIINKYECELVDTKDNKENIVNNIAKRASANISNEFLYSKILFPIIKGEDIIIESCHFSSFSNIIIPIVNIMFTANKRMMFICDNYDTVLNCSKWLEDLEIKTGKTSSNIVVDTLSYDNIDSIKIDSRVDIYIGTIDLVLNSKAVFENIDIVFCLNIDKIISESALNLNLFASVLSNDKNNNIQYILFSNRVNNLKQTASSVFMRNNFKYQIINNSVDKNLNVNFLTTDKGNFQNEILKGLASLNLGQLIPLTLPAFKYGFKHVDIISNNQAFSDQMITLQMTEQLIKKYINKDIINIDELINFTPSENFINIDNNSIVVVEDTECNIALVLLNWLKYTKTNMYLNIVTNPYILRDYLIANIDFFISNIETISNILPVSKSNIKLSVYRIINQLCYGNVLEEILLREIKNCGIKIDINTDSTKQEYFIKEALEKLVKKAFNINICFSSYLIKETSNNKNSLEIKYYYKLLESIKNELPDKLFKSISFIDSEKSIKILKKIPVFELYQNYLEGQHITFNGRNYLIDKIDYDNAIVELSYSNNITNTRYRQCREITNITNNTISREFPILKVRDSVLNKYILSTSLDVNTNGYYEFNNSISFIPGEYSYRNIDNNRVGLNRKYKSTNILAINITNNNILNMSDYEKFKISFTLSILLNEIFETLFPNIKQYILVRNVIKDTSIYSKYNNDELINLYKPIIDTYIQDGINIYITEDTELEKGITDTIANNFDNTILRLLYDYLYWLLKEDNIIDKSNWYQSENGNYINIENIDKLSFLKYGDNKLREYLDLEGVFDCLKELILNGNDIITSSRIEFVKNRIINQEFKISPINDKKRKEITKNDNIEKEEYKPKTFIDKIKEFLLLKINVKKEKSKHKV